MNTSHKRRIQKIKEYKGFLVDEKFNIYNSRTGNIVTPFIGTDGYMQVSRTLGSGHAYHIRVHILYANCFIPNPHGYKYVNHIDSDKTNNKLENLEWCTNSYNVKHGWDSGNRTHKNRTKVLVMLGNEEVGRYSSIREVSRELNIDRHKVARILKGELKNCYEYSFSYI